MTRGGQDSPIRQKHGRAGAVALYGGFERVLKGLAEAPKGLVLASSQYAFIHLEHHLEHLRRRPARPWRWPP